MTAVVVNLFAGPGTGKSTTAACVYALLKQKGVNCELAREWVKSSVWEGRVFPDQMYIFAKQQRAIRILVDKVDFVITDAPILLSNVYGGERETFRKLVLETFHEFTNVNYFLSRAKVYNPAGRLQTEEEARDLDVSIRYMLDMDKIPYKVITADQAAAENIVANLPWKYEYGL